MLLWNNLSASVATDRSSSEDFVVLSYTRLSGILQVEQQQQQQKRIIKKYRERERERERKIDR